MKLYALFLTIIIILDRETKEKTKENVINEIMQLPSDSSPSLHHICTDLHFLSLAN